MHYEIDESRINEYKNDISQLGTNLSEIKSSFQTAMTGCQIPKMKTVASGITQALGSMQSNWTHVGGLFESLKVSYDSTEKALMNQKISFTESGLSSYMNSSNWELPDFDHPYALDMGTKRVKIKDEIVQREELIDVTVASSKVAATKEDAKEGNYIEGNLNKSLFEGAVIREDGAIFSKNNILLGWTDISDVDKNLLVSKENINVNEYALNARSEYLKNNTSEIIKEEKEKYWMETMYEEQYYAAHPQYKYETSNTIAEAGRRMGLSEDEIKIAVGISRFETGNYKSWLAQNHNYGGLRMSGSNGRSDSGYGLFGSEEEGVNAFLNNLNKNYFSQGLNTPETIARKYLGHSNTSGWINGVYGSMS